MPMIRLSYLMSHTASLCISNVHPPRLSSIGWKLYFSVGCEHYSTYRYRSSALCFLSTYKINIFIFPTAVGVSPDPCSLVFPGGSPNSELETLSIINFVYQLQQEGTLIYYLAFHSFSQMVLIPYSHVEKGDVLEVPNYGDLVSYNLIEKTY